MKKVFISQPMNGKSNEEIKEQRNNCIEVVKKQYGDDIEVLDSFFENAPHDANPLWFLGKSILLLSAADIIVFAKGFEHYRGCRAEHYLCRQYHKEIIYEDPTVEMLKVE